MQCNALPFLTGHFHYHCYVEVATEVVIQAVAFRFVEGTAVVICNNMARYIFGVLYDPKTDAFFCKKYECFYSQW